MPTAVHGLAGYHDEEPAPHPPPQGQSDLRPHLLFLVLTSQLCVLVYISLILLLYCILYSHISAKIGSNTS